MGIAEQDSPKRRSIALPAQILFFTLQACVNVMSWIMLMWRDAWEWSNKGQVGVTPSHVALVFQPPSTSTPSILFKSLANHVVQCISWLDNAHCVNGRLSSSLSLYPDATPTPSLNHLTLYDKEGIFKKNALEIESILRSCYSRPIILSVGHSGRLVSPLNETPSLGTQQSCGNGKEAREIFLLDPEDVTLIDEEEEEAQDQEENSSTSSASSSSSALSSLTSSLSRQGLSAQPSSIESISALPLHIHILCKRDGKVAMSRQVDTIHSLKPFTVPQLHQRLVSDPAHEPNALLVFETPNSRCMLHGFPPWLLSGCELFFIPGDGRPRRWQVRQAMQRYQHIEQRHGK